MKTILHYLGRLWPRRPHVLPRWHRPVYHGVNCRVIASDWRTWAEAQRADRGERKPMGGNEL